MLSRFLAFFYSATIDTSRFCNFQIINQPNTILIKGCDCVTREENANCYPFRGLVRCDDNEGVYQEYFWGM